MKNLQHSKWIIGLIALLAALCLSAAACAGESGTCAENLTWTLDDDGVLTISGTGALTSLDFENRTDIKSLVVKEGVTKIGDSVFSGCTALADVSLPDSVAEIGQGAFQSCSGLTNITVPDGVKVLAAGAFSGCFRLRSVTIGKGLSTLQYAVFQGCVSLTDIMVDSANPDFSASDGILFSKSKSKLCVYPAGKPAASYTIPGNVSTIGHYAFISCDRLQTVTIPASVTGIETNAFVMSGLTKVTIPGSVKSIATFAFSNCPDLTEVTILNGVTAIPEAAFGECGRLARVDLPKSVTSVGFAAFACCGSLKDVYYTGSEEDRQKMSILGANDPLANAAWHYNSSEPESDSVTVDGGIYELSGNKKYAVFVEAENKNAKSLVIKDTVKIGKKTYKVTEIAEGACKGMGKLAKLTIGKNVKTIGAEAFSGCKKAKTITILGTALKKVGKNAFGGGYKKVTVLCPKKKIKTYRKLLLAAGLSKKSVFKELK